MAQQYAIGDHVRVRQVVGASAQRHPWHDGTIIAIPARKASWGWVRRYDVRLETGADAGSVLSVDRRNLQAIT